MSVRKSVEVVEVSGVGAVFVKTVFVVMLLLANEVSTELVDVNLDVEGGAVETAVEIFSLEEGRDVCDILVVVAHVVGEIILRIVSTNAIT